MTLHLILVDLVVDKQLDVQHTQAERERKNEEEPIYVQDQTQGGIYAKYGTPVQEYHLAVVGENGETEFCLRFVAQWLVHRYASHTCVIRIHDSSNTIVSNPLSMAFLLMEKCCR